MATAALLSITSELRRRMGTIPSLGIDACRPKRISGVLRPDKGYSEHAYGNAEDFAIVGIEQQRPYVAMLQKMRVEGYPVGWIGWRGNRTDYNGHIHVDARPALDRPGRVPPCAGGQPLGTDEKELKGSARRFRPAPLGDPEDGFSLDLPFIGEIGPLIVRVGWALLALGAGAATIAFVSAAFKTQVVKQATKGL